MKLQLTIILSAFLAINSFAQKVQFGLKAGLNMATVATDVPIKSQSKNGFHAGITADMALSKHLFLQPQLVFNTKGTQFDAPDGMHTHVIKINAIDLPINLIYKFSMGLQLGLGPNIGYNLSGKNTISGHAHANEESHTYKFDGKPFEYKRWDMGLNTMIGYDHKSGIGLTINYVKGLNSVSVADKNYWRSNVMVVSLGYKFTNKK
jgi:hypothetical protein